MTPDWHFKCYSLSPIHIIYNPLPPPHLSHTHKHSLLHTHTQTFTHTQVHSHTHVPTYSLYTYICIHVHSYTSTLTHVHTVYSCTYIDSHIQLVGERKNNIAIAAAGCAFRGRGFQKRVTYQRQYLLGIVIKPTIPIC